MAHAAQSVRSNVGPAQLPSAVRAAEAHREMMASESLHAYGHEAEPKTLRTKDSRYHLWPPLHPADRSASTPDADRIMAETVGRPASPRGESVRKYFSTSPRHHRTKASPQKKRKPSVTDLGPMTTVQEIPLDSPTIPGRPPLHERSASAPGVGGPGVSRSTIQQAKQASLGLGLDSNGKRKSLSPINLARLVIPDEERGPTTAVPVHRPSVIGEEEDEGTPPVPPPKSPWMEERALPMARCPTAPANISSLSLPGPSRSQSVSPMTAPEERAYARPWGTPTRGQSPASHQRNRSDTAIMDRGRPSHRVAEGIRDQSTSNSIRTDVSADLPSGLRAAELPGRLPDADVAGLQARAREQASQFEVLDARDVASMSRDLRSLDERCEYLRRTLNSLRMGRRGLHTRMVTYLKSPRMAKFSRESMLKQEEALGELDGSIDDWVAKLDRAENRRTRVRQKLLEHVAAALMLAPPAAEGEARSASPSPSQGQTPTSGQTQTSGQTPTSGQTQTSGQTPTPGQTECRNQSPSQIANQRHSRNHSPNYSQNQSQSPSRRQEQSPSKGQNQGPRSGHSPSRSQDEGQGLVLLQQRTFGDDASTERRPSEAVSPKHVVADGQAASGRERERDSQETVADDDSAPRTPERPSTPQRVMSRRDVESIKIYAELDVYSYQYPLCAESDVYALLEDVEQEISNMAHACEAAGVGGGANGYGHGAGSDGSKEQWISRFAKSPPMI
ncbi:MAG: hypothetical protein M1832_003017 [Thelocarpon impressellum]|nr:MAG: hypothetical protein M1832_003017 [Thelocarpon impressellum]